jgi:hypothetical protein
VRGIFLPLQRSRARWCLAEKRRQMFEEAHRKNKGRRVFDAAAIKQRARGIRQRRINLQGGVSLGSFLFAEKRKEHFYEL